MFGVKDFSRNGLVDFKVSGSSSNGLNLGLGTEMVAD